MKLTLKKTARIVLISFALILWSCENDSSSSGTQIPQDTSIQSAKKWFDAYEDKGKNIVLMQNLDYNWNDAQLTKSEDGTETIIVPINELKKDQGDLWEQKLYIYKSDEGRYSSLLFEAYSNKNIKPESQSVDGGDFTGYITVWDLKKGFVRGAKFLNNQVVEEGVAEFGIDRNKTNRAPETGECIFSDLDDGCHNDGGDGAAIPLREVIVKGPSKGTPVIYTPRGPVIGGTTPGGYTSPTGGGGASSGGGGSTSNNGEVYPDCASINFIKMAGLPWQEAAVRNINFKIQIIQSLTPLISSIETIVLPQAVSFQMPTNTTIGNTNITPGMAASIVAKAINAAMIETKNYYKAVPATELMVNQFFKKALKDNFELMVPGSRFQLNPIATVPPTEYKSNWFFPSNCN